MIPFSPPRIDDKIVKEVSQALQSGWITTGPRTKLLEQRLSEYCNVDKVLAVNSWTAGAELVLYWYGIQPGDEVIVPVYTYCASANIVVHRGAKVVMVDVSEDFGINIARIREAISSKTKAIISVDLGGYPIDYDALNALVSCPEIKNKFQPNTPAQEKLGKILTLSDAAHSLGANYKGKKVGALTDFTVFSFHAVKNLTTAEGGAICINLPTPFANDEVYKELNTLSLHGQNKDALAKTQKGNWEYDVIDAGFKCNMTDILAAIGLVELERYDSENLKRRKKIFQMYANVLSKKDWAILPTFKTNDRESSYHLFFLRIKGIGLSKRNEIIAKIFEKDVSVNVHYKPLPLLTVYKTMGYQMDDYPTAKQLWENEITLPVYFDLSDTQVNIVLNTLIEAVESTL